MREIWSRISKPVREKRAEFVLLKCTFVRRASEFLRNYFPSLIDFMLNDKDNFSQEGQLQRPDHADIRYKCRTYARLLQYIKSLDKSCLTPLRKAYCHSLNLLIRREVSIAVSCIGDTLILNTGPDVDEGEKIFRRQNNQPKGSDPSILKNFAMHSVRAEACDCPPSHQPSQDKRTASMLHGPFGHREGSFDSPSSSSFSTSPYVDQNVSKSRKPSESLYWGARENKKKVPGSDPMKKTSRVGKKSSSDVQESEKSRRVGNNGFRKVTIRINVKC